MYISDIYDVLNISFPITYSTVVSHAGKYVRSGVCVRSELPVGIIFYHDFISHVESVRNTFRVFCGVIFVNAFLLPDTSSFALKINKNSH